MDKVSEKLSALVETAAPEKEVRLNVMLRGDLGREEMAALARDLARLASDPDSVELLASTGMLFMRGRLAAVESIARHPGVEWVDRDNEAPMEELLDG